MSTHRAVVDCSLFLPKGPFDIAASATEEELLNIAVQYAVDSHGHWDTPALREELCSMLREKRKRKAVPEARVRRAAI
jgi:predicted small metal-binding protein